MVSCYYIIVTNYVIVMLIVILMSVVAYSIFIIFCVDANTLGFNISQVVFRNKDTTPLE